MEETHLTGVRKRQQIENTRKQVLIWVAIASASVVISIMLGYNIFQRISYQAKVNDEIAKTDKTMQDNVKSVDSLTKAVDNLKTDKSLNLVNLKSDDSTPFQVVIDSLPTANDSTALGASLQGKVLSNSGASIESLSITDTPATAQATTASAATSTTAGATASAGKVTPSAQPISFTFTISGGFDAVQNTIKDIERTIRPIVITNLSLDGSDTKLTATIQATTYYAPKASFELGEKEVQP